MRNKIEEDEKKPKISITIDTKLLSIMDEYLEKNDISNRSKYIENLIRENFIRKGIQIERRF